MSRLSLDIDTDDYDFLARLAEYRYAVKEAQLEGERNKSPGKRQTRKSIAENLIADGTQALRANLKAMLDAIGQLPGPVPDEGGEVLAKYREDVRKYVKRMLAWESKNNRNE